MEVKSAERRELDPRERRFRITGPVEGLQLFLRHLPPSRRVHDWDHPILFVHGMSFPSALSIAHRLDGRSWRDELCDQGFDVWGLDFYGFGGSDRYPQMDEPAERHPPLGRAEEASRQVECAVHFICEQHKIPRISLIAHSGASIATGRFAARCPQLIDRLVFFAPIARRVPDGAVRKPLAAWRLVSESDQWNRFTEDVPAGEKPVLSESHFRDWSERYLETDARSQTRSPPSVKVPSGILDEITAARHGCLGYDPGEVRAPVAIIRGEWDSVCTDEDAKWLFDALAASPVKRDVKISRATHLMHLEESRYALYRETQTFLEGEDMPRLQSGFTEEAVASSIPGYDYGRPDAAHSPVSLEELRQIEMATGWTDADAEALREHAGVFSRRAEQMVDSWRAVIAAQPHLVKWFFGRDEKPDDDYKAKVKKRFVQWVKDVPLRPHDREWLDYQEEIGLRHTPAKKNQTDGADTPPVVPLRYLQAFTGVVALGARRFFVEEGLSGERLQRLEDAWTKSVILHVTLWSRPYTKDGLW